MNLFNKFKIGLGKSSSDLSEGFTNIFSKKNINDSVLSEFEDLLISSDTGVEVAKQLRKDFESFKIDKKLENHKEILKLLADKMAIDLLKYEKDLSKLGNSKTAVIVVSGVNGVGKTTTIGKIGKYFKNNNKSIVFGAADTFRAAAVDQLQLWATKVKADIIKSEIGSDPASVAFKTAQFAKENQIDIALIDTAGRLQNKKNLMDEYKKIITVLKKIDPSYPNEIILVLDATTGQNALNQVEEFSKIHNLTGLIITKLDTSAKGGIVLAICKKYNLPIVAVGMGEKEEDLHPFNSEYFSKALLGISS
ncbi:signal recognition particle-docking protein FtsY [Pelagibacteraceae bacterium]|jgi:fused signal recognition particle receptor|nr:signal recognition particle-docking protein FtsY [Pelagibacteraceae bacterium]|tara:strand:+ start:95 stop:1015 length:921 start_codon:yes stop_codon:yes gene_type:complete